MQPALRTLPRGVIALGFVSLFMDISSEMIQFEPQPRPIAIYLVFER